jgi:16S rRNA (cytosine1402-N4)-methyltransferase
VAMENTYHKPVLLQQCIDALSIQPNGKYVDVTFGGGGHSHEIIQKLNKGKLYAFDQDDDALGNLPESENLIFVNHNFRFLKRFLQYHHAVPVDGILADLGISSYQIDTAEKGFSIRFSGPLDMRMNQSAGLTAQDVLMNYTEEELLRVFAEYGEVRNSKTLAAAVVEARSSGMQFSTTDGFAFFLRTMAMGNENKYMAQVFQALRIEVNDEMNALKEMLQQSYEVLGVGGRLVVLTYHSLEDRLVKNFMKSGNFEGEEERDEFGVTKKFFRLVNKKPIEADFKEIKQNPRARSAKLRIAEKI